MTTPQTDAIMALADRYAFHIPGSQHSDEARAVLLAALQSAQPVALPLDTKRLFSEWYDSLPYGEPSYQETFEAGVKAGIGGAL